jgi:predicted membrane channel-forming protein YqfA (hemolysin III family)
MARAMAEPSTRTITGIALILLLIGVWAAFVASLARVVGTWPILLQAPFYLVMGIIWIIPLKPLLRWIQTGSFRDGSGGQD